MAFDLESVKNYLAAYDGPTVRIMEVCGSHTAAISKLGIPSLLSEKIQLISGPGCPVCVTPTAYIDRLIDLSLTEGCAVCTFGDLLRVPGSRDREVRTLNLAKGKGGKVYMLYSPMDILPLAEQHPETTWYFAAVGFETTTPVYALLLQALEEQGITNVKLVTALKTMPAVIAWLCENDAQIDAFLAPGHVSVVTGSKVFRPLAERYRLPFVVSGFQGGELLAAIYGAVRSVGQGQVLNLYPSVVTEQGNCEAQDLVSHYFQPCSAVWRGMGEIPGSGMMLRPAFSAFEGGSAGLNRDNANPACSCGAVLSGKLRPGDCPLFGRGCNPMNPQGACMVSTEGSCFQYFTNHRDR
ncbi:MAG: hydrogenase formation protein HypD [Clostridiales bacterium]|nr:hydrogenase formation protein HypD [Clostridiales bacterium]